MTTTPTPDKYHDCGHRLRCHDKRKRVQATPEESSDVSNPSKVSLLMRHARLMRAIDILTASANRELALGGWTVDWSEGVEILLDEAKEIERKYDER